MTRHYQSSSSKLLFWMVKQQILVVSLTLLCLILLPETTIIIMAKSDTLFPSNPTLSSSKGRIVVEDLDYWSSSHHHPFSRRVQGIDDDIDIEDPLFPAQQKQQNHHHSLHPLDNEERRMENPETLRLHLLEEKEKEESSSSSSFTCVRRPFSLLTENPYDPTRFQYHPKTAVTASTASAYSTTSTTTRRRVYKTGTTIAGCVIRLKSSSNSHDEDDGDYVLLAADTRATESTMIADPNCEKIHGLADNVYCCGAGTSADCDHVTRQCMYSMALEALLHASNHEEDEMEETKKDGMNTITTNTTTITTTSFDSTTNSDQLIVSHQVSLDQATTWLQDILFEQGGALGVNLIIGGVWKGRGELRALHPHGSMDRGLPFAALGSGGWAAMSVLEQGYSTLLRQSSPPSSDDEEEYRPNIATASSLEHAIQLVTRAIRAGIQNDLGSGSHVDLCIIRPNGSSNYTRHVIPEDELPEASSSSSSSWMSEHRREDLDVETSSSSSSSSSSGSDSTTNSGVNGFGNLPFAIRSRQVRRASHREAEQECQSPWDHLLNLPDDNDEE